MWKFLGDMFTEEQNELVESAAEMLYGLIHVRYILTSKGMSAMVKFRVKLSLLLLPYFSLFWLRCFVLGTYAVREVQKL